MQYVAIIAAILALFKDTFSGIFKSRESKFILIGLGAYYVYTVTRKKEQKEDILSNLPNNEAGLLAERLHNAFHPLISEPIFGWYPPDGTDEEAVKTIAIQMGKLKNYTAVSEAYGSLFSSSLDTDLRSEGVFDLFFNNYNAQTQTGTPTTNPTNPTNTGGTVKVMVGSQAYVSQANVNIRSSTSDGKVLRTSVKGEFLGTVMQIQNKTIAGISGTWITCAKPTNNWGIFSDYTVVFAQYVVPVKP